MKSPRSTFQGYLGGVGTRTQWRGQVDTTDRRMRWLVLLSLLAHTPMTPLFALFGLFSWLSAPPPDLADAPPVKAIPVDLLEADELGAPAAAPDSPAPAPPPEPQVVAEPTAPKPKPKPPRDAGLPDAAADADAPDASGDAETPDAAADAGADAGDAGPGRADGGADPLAALGGNVSNLVDLNANVRVTIYTEKIRVHPLAPRIGALLGSIYQWRDFFGPTGLDPIRDVDRISVVGSQFRNSKDVVAILKLNVPAEQVKAAIDGIVRSDTEHGEWLDAGVPAATAYADRAPRVFVMGTKGVVIVAPPTLLEDAVQKAKTITIGPGKGPEIVAAYVVTPSRVRGLPVRIPESIRWVRLWAKPLPDGGALLEALAEDESPELAAEHAEQLERNLTAAATLDLGLLGQVLGMRGGRLVERIDLEADGKQIRGEAVVTARQLSEILGFAEMFLVPARREPTRPTPSSRPLRAPEPPGRRAPSGSRPAPLAP